MNEPSLSQNGDKPLLMLDALLCTQLAQAEKEMAFERVNILLKRKRKIKNLEKSEKLIEHFRGKVF